jgi:hypothetical protein
VWMRRNNRRSSVISQRAINFTLDRTFHRPCWGERKNRVLLPGATQALPPANFRHPFRMVHGFSPSPARIWPTVSRFHMAILPLSRAMATRRLSGLPRQPIDRAGFVGQRIEPLFRS